MKKSLVSSCVFTLFFTTQNGYCMHKGNANSKLPQHHSSMEEIKEDPYSSSPIYSPYSLSSPSYSSSPPQLPFGLLSVFEFQDKEITYPCIYNSIHLAMIKRGTPNSEQTALEIYNIVVETYESVRNCGISPKSEEEDQEMAEIWSEHFLPKFFGYIGTELSKFLTEYNSKGYGDKFHEQIRKIAASAYSFAFLNKHSESEAPSAGMPSSPSPSSFKTSYSSFSSALPSSSMPTSSSFSSSSAPEYSLLCNMPEQFLLYGKYFDKLSEGDRSVRQAISQFICLARQKNKRSESDYLYCNLKISHNEELSVSDKIVEYNIVPALNRGLLGYMDIGDMNSYALSFSRELSILNVPSKREPRLLDIRSKSNKNEKIGIQAPLLIFSDIGKVAPGKNCKSKSVNHATRKVALDTTDNARKLFSQLNFLWRLAKQINDLTAQTKSSEHQITQNIKEKHSPKTNELYNEICSLYNKIRNLKFFVDFFKDHNNPELWSYILISLQNNKSRKSQKDSIDYQIVNDFKNRYLFESAEDIRENGHCCKKNRLLAELQVGPSPSDSGSITKFGKLSEPLALLLPSNLCDSSNLDQLFMRLSCVFYALEYKRRLEKYICDAYVKLTSDSKGIFESIKEITTIRETQLPKFLSDNYSVITSSGPCKILGQLHDYYKQLGYHEAIVETLIPPKGQEEDKSDLDNKDVKQNASPQSEAASSSSSLSSASVIQPSRETESRQSKQTSLNPVVSKENAGMEDTRQAALAPASSNKNAVSQNTITKVYLPDPSQTDEKVIECVEALREGNYKVFYDIGTQIHLSLPDLSSNLSLKKSSLPQNDVEEKGRGKKGEPSLSSSSFAFGDSASVAEEKSSTISDLRNANAKLKAEKEKLQKELNSQRETNALDKEQLKNAQEQLKGQGQTIGRLNDQIKELTQQREKADRVGKEKNEQEIQNRVTALNSELSRIRAQNEEFLRGLHDVKEENEKLKRDKADTLAELNDLKQWKETIKEKAQLKFNEELRKKKEEILTLRKKVEKLEKEKAEAEDAAQKRFEILQRSAGEKLEEVKKQNWKLSIENKGLDERLGEQQVIINGLLHQKVRQEREIKDNEDRMQARLRNINEEYERRYEYLREQYENQAVLQEQEYLRNIQEQKEELEALREQLKRMQQEKSQSSSPAAPEKMPKEDVSNSEEDRGNMEQDDSESGCSSGLSLSIPSASADATIGSETENHDNKQQNSEAVVTTSATENNSNLSLSFATQNNDIFSEEKIFQASDLKVQQEESLDSSGPGSSRSSSSGSISSSYSSTSSGSYSSSTASYTSDEADAHRQETASYNDFSANENFPEPTRPVSPLSATRHHSLDPVSPATLRNSGIPLGNKRLAISVPPESWPPIKK